ncbi:hypothetical protein [Kocuria tytonis]|uniref:Uncharacterized protein n=1 Tax=Kocuria tytonis TaxID=2054280 RepID=A0A495A5F9_9MICC|nr:hypothetical protein [Kocuria tytonis]RKQ34959.1 hypothetical protein C1C97_006650 [Kocuria tytonis]
MAEKWETDLAAWTAGWAAIREDAPQPSVQAWNGSVPPGGNAVLVCPPDRVTGAREALAAAGRTVTATEVLLAGAVQDLDRGLSFPGDAGMFDAPMGGYSRFEVDEWGRPVAHAALSVQGEVAFMGPLSVAATTDRDPAEVLDPLVSAMANEAFLADAERLYTVVPEEDVPGRESQGWRRVAFVLHLA